MIDNIIWYEKDIKKIKDIDEIFDIYDVKESAILRKWSMLPWMILVLKKKVMKEDNG